MDDSGYFSVQVISEALKVWGLELVPYTSTEDTAIMAQNDPSQMRAYICNYKGHWFTIRKLGKQWFNLNSMQSGPLLISDTYLAMYLAQLIQEGYSIFVVLGVFPSCEADEVLSKNPLNPKLCNSQSSINRPSTSSQGQSSTNKVQTKENEQLKFPSKGYRLGTKAEEDAKIQQAVQALGNVVIPSSLGNRRPEVEIISETPRQPRERIIPIKVEGRNEVYTIDDDDDNAQLQEALQLSLKDYEQEQRDKNLKLRLKSPSTSTSNFSKANSADDDEDDELRKAVQLSLECVTAPPTPDQDDIRLHRLNYLLMHPRGPQAESSTKLNT